MAEHVQKQFYVFNAESGLLKTDSGKGFDELTVATDAAAKLALINPFKVYTVLETVAAFKAGEAPIKKLDVIAYARDAARASIQEA